ncbi:MAG: hypothetical protein M1826_002407 [Phylliscum demangeonii]|nr:MAG: hypothetical protein M1826_002407 [Phylliscum demangeonii]
MAMSSCKRPVIAIVGATGTGKSRLAVELAARFNGEIINGDAMQLYDGLPIITNKISLHDQQGIPHHLLGCVKLDEEPWTVEGFVREGSRAIRDIQSRGCLPILVGGTHYYIQALLSQYAGRAFESSGAAAGAKTGTGTASEAEHLTFDELHRRFPILTAPSEEIWARLKEVDPVMANRWHPSDRRRVHRSLTIYLTTGQRASEWYEEQRQAKPAPEDVPDAAPADHPTRIPLRSLSAQASILILWIHVPPDVLHERLDARVHGMLERGLLSEIGTLHAHRPAPHPPPHDPGQAVDKTRGIWVSIGYRQFEAFYHALGAGTASSAELGALKQEAIFRTQVATRQYAKQQTGWIRQKLAQAVTTAGLSGRFFVLDGGGREVEQWRERVFQPAADLVARLLAGHTLPAPATVCPGMVELLAPRHDWDISDRPDLWVRQSCEICGTVALTERAWTLHVQGRRHRRARRQRRRRSLALVIRPTDASGSDDGGLDRAATDDDQDLNQDGLEAS